MPSAVVTFNGRVTIPSQIRKQLGLKTGDSIEFVEMEQGRYAIVHGSESNLDFDQVTVQQEVSDLVI